MARQPRYVLPGQPQHLIQRGNNGAAVFQHENDYLFYLLALSEACMTQQCAVHAYVLMPNHVHLLLTPSRETGISKAMQSVSGRYTQYVNSTYHRKGTLWEGRYRSTVIDPGSYLFHCMRYIELNPVRAGMASQPQVYRWSSYGFNADSKQDAVITPHPLYRKLGATPGVRCERYRAPFGQPFSEPMLNDIRNATNKGWVLGSAEFIAQIEEQVNRRTKPLPRGGDRRSTHSEKENLQ